MRCVSLTTDFGLDDGYVGQMKAAALAVAPDLVLVDLCHAVPPHDVASGAWILETGCGAFPDGTVHVAVVDPGVGTERAAIAVETERYLFVGPDNGVLARALADHPPRRAHRIEEARSPRPRGGTTFDGRDLFAPAAARLARGIDLAALGAAADRLAPAPALPVRPERGRPVRVPVVHTDRFGNVILDVRERELRAALGAPPGTGTLVVRAGERAIERLRTAYAAGERKTGEPFLLVDSAGYLEIALDRGSAADALGLRAGDEVTLVAGGSPTVV